MWTPSDSIRVSRLRRQREEVRTRPVAEILPCAPRVDIAQRNVEEAVERDRSIARPVATFRKRDYQDIRTALRRHRSTDRSSAEPVSRTPRRRDLRDLRPRRRDLETVRMGDNDLVDEPGAVRRTGSVSRRRGSMTPISAPRGERGLRPDGRGRELVQRDLLVIRHDRLDVPVPEDERRRRRPCRGPPLQLIDCRGRPRRLRWHTGVPSGTWMSTPS